MKQNPATLDLQTVRARVTELLTEFYGRGDRGESIADLLEEDAEFVTPIRNAKGRDAITALMLSLSESKRKAGGAGRHFGTNIVVEDVGAGRFRVRSLMLFLTLDAGPGATGFMNVGDHDDLVAFDSAGVCRFVKRSMVPAAQYSLHAPQKRA